MGIGFGSDRELLDDLDVVAFEPHDFARVVGEEPDPADAQIGENLGAEPVFAQVHREPQFFVGLDGIEPLLLKFVGVDFRPEPDPPPLLPHVNQDARAGFPDALHRLVQLRAAIAPPRSEDIAGEAFAVDAHERRLAGGNLSEHQRDVVQAIDQRAVKMQVEIPVIGRHQNRFLALDQLLALPAVGDEVLDRAELQPVLALEFHQIRKPRHRAVFLENFANDAGRIEPRQPGQVHGGFGVSRSLKNPAGLCLQREHVPGLDEIGRPRAFLREHADRRRTVFGADAGADACGRVHRDREVGFEKLAVVGDHPLEPQLLGALFGDRRADEPPSVLRHEIHCGRRDFGGGHQEIPLVFPVGVIGDDHHPPASNVGNHGGDRVERCLHKAGRTSYRPIRAPAICFKMRLPIPR